MSKSNDVIVILMIPVSLSTSLECVLLWRVFPVRFVTADVVNPILAHEAVKNLDYVLN